jgi:DNA-directed RNA polymerase specialized sigma24 family protein
MKLWKYRRDILFYLYSKTKDYNLAEEITSDVYFNLLTRNFNIKEETEKSYLYGMAKNALVDRFRKKRFENFEDLLKEPSYEEIFEDDGLLGVVKDLLGKDFELFNSYSMGEDYNSLSRSYGVSNAGLRKKIQRLKEKLKKDIRVVAFLD